MFAPGDEIVCVKRGKWASCKWETTPVYGTHYTVRSLYDDDGKQFVRLKEIVNEPGDYWQGRAECAFWSGNFRPVRRETIAVFREMCTAISSGRTLVRVGE